MEVKSQKRRELNPDYERRRFGESWEQRRRNARERAAVDRFLASLPKGSSVLDVPCGMGRFYDLVLKHGHSLRSVDLDPKHVADTARRTSGNATLRGNALALPFRDNSNDVALCIRLTHHFDGRQVRQLFAELARTTRGDVLITYYNANAWKIWKKRMRGKSTGRRHAYTFSQLSHIARDCGFTAVAWRPWFGFFSHPCQFLWLRKKQIKKVKNVACRFRDDGRF